MKHFILILFVVLVVQFIHSKDKWQNDESWLTFIAENQELYDEIYAVAKRLKRKYANLSDVKKLQKIMNDRPYDEQEILTRILQHVKEVKRFDDPSYNAYTGSRNVYINAPGERRDSMTMEEITVIGRMFDQFPINPEEFSYEDIVGMRGIRAEANQLYREERYDEAYPLLLDLAKRGFKDSQSRLAYIFFAGTENINKSNLRGLGWLGTAAHGESEPQFRVLFKKYITQVPDDVRPFVDEILAGYREKFDSSAYIDCTTNHRFNSGVVKKTFCRFDLEAQVEACQGMACSVMKVNTDDS